MIYHPARTSPSLPLSTTVSNAQHHIAYMIVDSVEVIIIRQSM